MIHVYVMGRLGSDAEIKYTQNQTACIKLGIASTKKVKEEFKTTWVDVMIWGKMAEDLYAQNTLKKGCKVFIDGDLEVNEWTDKQGAKRKSVYVNARNVLVAAPTPQRPQSEQKFPTESGPFASMTEDDIPF